MDDLLDKIPFLIVVVLSVIAWIRQQLANKQEEAEAQRTREEMIRGLEEMQKASERRHVPPVVGMPPVPKDPQPHSTPPPLVWQSPRQTKSAPPPLARTAPMQPAKPSPPAMPAPAATTRSIDFHEQLDQARRASKEAALLADQARAKRLRADAKAASHQAASLQETSTVGLKQTLRQKNRVRQAFVLREILGPPHALTDRR